MSQDITVSPFYHSAVNAITKPNKATWCSNYFIDRWMPLLGNEGTRIVLALRRKGYNDHKGNKREEITISRAELAALVGCSEDTLTREMGNNKKTGRPQNEALQLFVRRFRHTKRDPNTGRVWQETNGYGVAMDDPVHPDDWPLVETYVKEREAETEKAHEPETQNALPVKTPKTQSATPAGQSASATPQNAEPETQNALPINKAILDSELPLVTPNDAARHGDSLALFEEQEKPATVAASHDILAAADSSFARDWRARKKKGGAV